MLRGRARGAASPEEAAEKPAGRLRFQRLDLGLQLADTRIRAFQRLLLNDHGLRQQIGRGRLGLDLLIDKRFRLPVARGFGRFPGPFKKPGEKMTFFR